MKPFSLLIARQRSGTGALGSVLDQQPDLHYLGEVFHPDNLGQESNYFTFLLDRVAKNPRLALPDANQENFEAFIDYVTVLSRGKLPIIDIKYRSLHHMNGGWHGLHARPWVLDNAIQNNAPIIHLKRSNFVETFVSGRLADANKVWHAAVNDEIKVRSVDINVTDLQGYIETTDAEVRLVDQWVSVATQKVTIEYAGMICEDGILNENVARQIESVLGIATMTKRSPAFVKQAPKTLRESINNFRMVRVALAGTKHSWMVDA